MLNKCLTSVEKIFLWAIKKGQQKHLEGISRIIEHFDPTLPMHNLLEQLVDVSMDAILKVNPRIIRFYENRIVKLSNANNFHHFPDVLVPPLLKAINRDQTNTFRPIQEYELKLILRSTAIFIERPIVEGDTFAGTKEHRQMALENLIRLLGR